MHTSAKTSALKVLGATAVILILNIAGWAQATERILYSFTGSGDGESPLSGLVADGKGNFYGTTAGGGTGTYCHCGTAFELSPGLSGTWSEQVLYSFSSGVGDGSEPSGGLVFDSKGNLYGTTAYGGTFYQGTVFELTPGANGTWSEKVLYSFTGGANGNSPYGSNLTIDSAGNLYGTTFNGGAFGFGVVFELVAGTNGAWTEKVLYSFTGDNDGSNPYATSLVVDGAGNVYGITRDGGAHDYGVVFRLTPQLDGTWSEKIIYALTGAGGESSPTGGLLLDNAGNLYGVGFDVFELIPGSNGKWSKKTLHAFTGPPDGAYPECALISDKAGNLYGTTLDGGNHHGTVFELLPGANGTWREKVLHRFSSTGGDGVFPSFAPLTMDASGNLYGTTEYGGASNAGAVFEVTP
jgi:uncharacterized repeat protein (TIGR03803 family)